jgi:cellulose synthase/poly-beta-1,6-N-acetylglucosamine synthase-like glycosyltransferase
MALLAEVGFWTALAMLVYAYAGFPLVVAAAGVLQRRTVRKAPATPSVSFIVVAYNEAAVIDARLRNVFALDYPADRLEVIVASDGSTDGTEELAAAYADRGVRVLALPRRGKIPALNDAVAHAAGDILVFSDANIDCDRQALRTLVSNFSDPTVGGVAGHCAYLVDAHAESSGQGERMYWNYDTWLKTLESHCGSIVSAHGALYAVRRPLFRPLTDAGVTDDFAISTAVIEQGYRLVFEPDARAFEYTTAEARREMGRRVRLMSRGLRGVWLRRGLLNPVRYGFYSVSLFSHKILRRLAPLWLIVLALSSAVLALTREPLYVAAAAGQAMFYTLASLGAALRGRPLGRAKPLLIPFYYCMANAASAAAIVLFLRGKRIALWRPQRSA